MGPKKSQDNNHLTPNHKDAPLLYDGPATRLRSRLSLRPREPASSFMEVPCSPPPGPAGEQDFEVVLSKGTPILTPLIPVEIQPKEQNAYNKTVIERWAILQAREAAAEETTLRMCGSHSKSNGSTQEKEVDSKMRWVNRRLRDRYLAFIQKVPLDSLPDQLGSLSSLSDSLPGLSSTHPDPSASLLGLSGSLPHTSDSFSTPSDSYHGPSTYASSSHKGKSANLNSFGSACEFPTCRKLFQNGQYRISFEPSANLGTPPKFRNTLDLTHDENKGVERNLSFAETCAFFCLPCFDKLLVPYIQDNTKAQPADPFSDQPLKNQVFKIPQPGYLYPSPSCRIYDKIQPETRPGLNKSFNLSPAEQEAIRTWKAYNYNQGLSNMSRRNSSMFCEALASYQEKCEVTGLHGIGIAEFLEVGIAEFIEKLGNK